jgi:pSer/pThr/pTyr-binding forkhead associated (FHA) protein
MSLSSSRLIVRTGPNAGMVFDLTKDVTTIGRDVTNDIVFGDSEVSRQHARLTRTPGGFVLEDLGSTNGSFVNSERLTAPRVLNPDDLIGFGDKVTLSFDAMKSDTDATVLSGAQVPSNATVLEAPPVVPAYTPPPIPVPVDPVPVIAQPTPPPQAYYEVDDDDEEKRPFFRSGWFAAGCGCLVILGILGAFLWFMDAYYPEILYAPLRLLGF